MSASTVSVSAAYRATINREAPWAKDASVSSRGHEATIRSPFFATEAELLGWLAINAPEMERATRRHTVDLNTRTDEYVSGANDHRGYYTEIVISRPIAQPEEEKVTPAPTVEQRQQIRRAIQGFEPKHKPEAFDACAIGDLVDFFIFAQALATERPS